MSFLPLNLGAGLVAGVETGAKPALDKKQTEKIFNRDGHSCRFCGFTSKKFQRIVANPTAEGDSDVTACSFCEQTLYPDRTAISGAGILIWLPEIEQAELNHIVRAIYIARDGEGAAASAADKALNILTARRSEAKKRLGTDDPIVVATVLTEALDKKNAARAIKKLGGIRLLPADKHLARTQAGMVNQFEKMLSYWSSPEGAYGQTPPESWADLAAVRA